MPMESGRVLDGSGAVLWEFVCVERDSYSVSSVFFYSIIVTIVFKAVVLWPL